MIDRLQQLTILPHEPWGWAVLGVLAGVFALAAVWEWGLKPWRKRRARGFEVRRAE